MYPRPMHRRATPFRALHTRFGRLARLAGLGGAVVRLAVLCAVAAIVSLGALAANAATIERFELTGIADKVIALPDGTLIFADAHGSALSRYDPATGAITAFSMGRRQVRNPTLGADGHVWFTADSDRQIGRYALQTATQFPSLALFAFLIALINH